MNRHITLVAAIGAAITIAGLAAASEADPGGRAVQGKAIYVQHCKACHGPQGRGGGYGMFPSSVADLTSPATKRKSDAELREVLREGRPHPAMGSWKSVLSETQIDAVVAYVRTFNPGAEP
jgi:mono/diheme cytochrome c family protein